MFKIKFIKNPPTVDNLRSIYESEIYQNLLKEYDKTAKYKLEAKESSMGIINILADV